MAEQFNALLKEVFKTFRDLPSGMKCKLHINELQSKMNTGMRAEPEYAISIMGPLVWRARDEIAARNAAFFLARRYEVDLTALCKEHDVNYDDAINTVNFMKDAYKSASPAVQGHILDLLQQILAVVAQREIAKRTQVSASRKAAQ